MTGKEKSLLICSCEGTMPLDGAALQRICGRNPGSHNQLCRAEMDSVRARLAAGESLHICCTQEAPLFDELAGEAGNDATISYVNIRETAGWSDEAVAATPKIAALIAAATVEAAPTRTVTVRSEGRALVYGSPDQALEVADQLHGRLDVTVVLMPPGDALPRGRTRYPVFRGRVAGIAGSLGGFHVTVDDCAAALPSSRDVLKFGPAQRGVVVEADIVIDLSGGTPLLSGGETRDGYFRPDPGNPAAVQKALFEAADLTGEFEKPIYVAYTESLCAHARSAVTGCNRCLDLCPASAISPAGDHVAIDAHLCAGCGTCSSVCPTGAAAYDFPAARTLFEQLRTLLRTYAQAGGRNAVVLFHDGREGADMIALMSRLGRGLPARIIPVELNEVTQIGFDVLAATIAWGAERVLLYAGDHAPERLEGLTQQVGYLRALLDGLGYEGDRVVLLDERDPDALCDMLYALEPLPDREPASFLPVGGRRSLSAFALHHLHDAAPTPVDAVALPDGAPYGRVTIDVDGCTLCLACVGACPTDALSDNPDAPMLRFTEQACIQCGLCRNTCPEKVMTLEPRISFAPEAASAILLKEEEPFECVSCGKPFGARSSVERTIERLAKHPMFANDEAALNRLRMCEDCRVLAQFSAGQPMAHGTPRRTRTTDDYLTGKSEDDC